MGIKNFLLGEGSNDKLVETLKAKVKAEVEARIDAETRLVNLMCDIDELKLSHRRESSRSFQDHELKISHLQDEIEKIKFNFDVDVENAIVEKENQLIDRESALEAKYRAKEVALEATFAKKEATRNREHIEKLARMDKKLEEDKASYRKWLRQEHNKLVDTLTSENTRLVKDNSKLEGRVHELSSYVEVGMNQTESLSQMVSAMMGTLPKISANFSTPTVEVVMPQLGSGNGGTKPQVVNK